MLYALRAIRNTILLAQNEFYAKVLQAQNVNIYEHLFLHEIVSQIFYVLLQFVFEIFRQ